MINHPYTVRSMLMKGKDDAKRAPGKFQNGLLRSMYVRRREGDALREEKVFHKIIDGSAIR